MGGKKEQKKNDERHIQPTRPLNFKSIRAVLQWVAQQQLLQQRNNSSEPRNAHILQVYKGTLVFPFSTCDNPGVWSPKGNLVQYYVSYPFQFSFIDITSMWFFVCRYRINWFFVHRHRIDLIFRLSISYRVDFSFYWYPINLIFRLSISYRFGFSFIDIVSILFFVYRYRIESPCSFDIHHCGTTVPQCPGILFALWILCVYKILTILSAWEVHISTGTQKPAVKTTDTFVSSSSRAELCNPGLQAVRFKAQRASHGFLSSDEIWRLHPMGHDPQRKKNK